MMAVGERIPVRAFEPPEAETVLIPIDVTRGCVATDATPEENIRYIRFRPGTEPTGTCVYLPVVAPEPSISPSVAP
jgi:hypothetical protein